MTWLYYLVIDNLPTLWRRPTLMRLDILRRLGVR